MFITYNLDGSITISDIVDNIRVKRMYFEYTKKEAIKLFKKEFNI